MSSLTIVAILFSSYENINVFVGSPTSKISKKFVITIFKTMVNVFHENLWWNFDGKKTSCYELMPYLIRIAQSFHFIESYVTALRRILYAFSFLQESASYPLLFIAFYCILLLLYCNMFYFIVLLCIARYCIAFCSFVCILIHFIESCHAPFYSILLYCTILYCAEISCVRLYSIFQWMGCLQLSQYLFNFTPLPRITPLPVLQLLWRFNLSVAKLFVTPLACLLGITIFTYCLSFVCVLWSHISWVDLLDFSRIWSYLSFSLKLAMHTCYGLNTVYICKRLSFLYGLSRSMLFQSQIFYIINTTNIVHSRLEKIIEWLLDNAEYVKSWLID